MATVLRKRLLATAHTSIAPFLYQTNTLRAYSTKPEDTDDLDQDTPNTSPSTTNNGTKPRPSYLQRHASWRLKQSAPLRKQKSQQQQQQEQAQLSRKFTITRGEKQVFQELLGELEKSGTNLTEATRRAAESSPHKDSEGEMTQISALFDSVLAEFRKKEKRREERSERQRRSNESDEAMRLAEEAEEAESQVDISELLGEEGRQMPIERAIKIIVQRESTKIENALQAAIDEDKGDIGIWEICKARIFSMLQTVPGVAPGTQQQQEQDTTTTTDLEIPASVPREPVVISLYPQMLLVSFRLLNLHFPNSPLISQFRSTIKSHGRASAVLGTSTGLYNELIYFYWRGCNDLAGVTSLLQEMEVIGVEPNQRTVGILRGILSQREKDLKRHWYLRKQAMEQGRDPDQVGGFGIREPWWDMAPNRRVVKELLGPDGWVHRLEERVKKLRRNGY